MERRSKRPERLSWRGQTHPTSTWAHRTSASENALHGSCGAGLRLHVHARGADPQAVPSLADAGRETAAELQPAAKLSPMTVLAEKVLKGALELDSAERAEVAE